MAEDLNETLPVSLFGLFIYIQYGAGVYLRRNQEAVRPVGSSDHRVVQLTSLKPEAPLSALLPTNNEIERSSKGREHDEVFYR